jgi:hypothetical protein
LYVVFLNFNAVISTVEFGVDFGPNWPLMYAGDVHNPGSLHLGWSYAPGPGTANGVTITYPTPGNGFGPFVAMRIQTLWLCDDCDLDSVPWQWISVIPHEMTGNLHAVVFSTYEVIDGIGMNSLICPRLISTEERTWGGVKALYR